MAVIKNLSLKMTFKLVHFQGKLQYCRKYEMYAYIVYRYLSFDFILLKYAHYMSKPNSYLSVALVFSFIFNLLPPGDVF